MANRKRKLTKVTIDAATLENDTQAAATDNKIMISGPKLRAALSISAPTLWRWRRAKDRGFPVGKRINGRLYFPWHEVRAWLDRQPDAV